ncbi:MAG: MBOAT family protein, partial [Deltaproteobacteria bacterium]|nr:MBOAT family protein [Deltaproteobacteria bacterium]
PRHRGGMLLVASYWFYMCWKPEFLVLIVFVTVVNWGAALRLHRARSSGARKAWLAGAAVCSLGLLAVFKYLGFLARSAEALAALLGGDLGVPVLDLALPVGISFFTFQALAYTVDVYRRTLEPEPRLGTFALFVAFFPQLVAGPIERSTNLLPQLRAHHGFDAEAVLQGLKRIAWGLFQKMAVADRLAQVVDPVYESPGAWDSPSLWGATFLFSVQIYCDFAGYTSIAIGVARMMGIDLMENFRRPWLAWNIQDFWRRWHISLSTWFRDYVYIPLGGSRRSRWRVAWNVLLVFVLSGLWHGAAWTFVLWGLVHGAWLAVHTLLHPPGPAEARSRTRRMAGSLATLAGVTLAWVLFRAKDPAAAWAVYRGMAGAGTGLRSLLETGQDLWIGVALVMVLFWKDLADERGASPLPRGPVPRLLAWVVLGAAFLLLADFGGVSFIYFQF